MNTRTHSLRSVLALLLLSSTSHAQLFGMAETPSMEGLQLAPSSEVTHEVEAPEPASLNPVELQARVAELEEELRSRDRSDDAYQVVHERITARVMDSLRDKTPWYVRGRTAHPVPSAQDARDLKVVSSEIRDLRKKTFSARGLWYVELQVVTTIEVLRLGKATGNYNRYGMATFETHWKTQTWRRGETLEITAEEAAVLKTRWIPQS